MQPETSAKTEALCLAGNHHVESPSIPSSTRDTRLHHRPPDRRDTLEACCLVSKSWVPRTRKHLFADVKFRSPAHLKLWKEAFPDQSNSPACHTHTLLVACPEEVTTADAEQGGWIRSFSRVERFEVYSNPTRFRDPVVSLAPFHGLSPILKSLRIHSNTLSNSQIFDLICSLPLLEDLTLAISGIEENVFNPDASLRATSPAFTGALDLTVFEGMGSTARRLLGLPKSLRFRELTLSWLHEEDTQWIAGLVVGCSDTLERLIFNCCLRMRSSLFCARPAIDLHSQVTQARLLSTSQKRLSSEMSLFHPYRRTSNGSLLHYKPSHPDIETSDVYVFTYLTKRPVPESMLGDRLEKQHMASGWHLTAFSPNCGSRAQFVPMSRASGQDKRRMS